MDSLTKALEKLNLSEEYYFGDNLLKEQYFLEDAKKKIEEFFDSTNCSFYYGRKMMTFSVELSTLPSSELQASYYLILMQFWMYILQKKVSYMKWDGVQVICLIREF